MWQLSSGKAYGCQAQAESRNARGGCHLAEHLDGDALRAVVLAPGGLATVTGCRLAFRLPAGSLGLAVVGVEGVRIFREKEEKTVLRAEGALRSFLMTSELSAREGVILFYHAARVSVITEPMQDSCTIQECPEIAGCRLLLLLMLFPFPHCSLILSPSLGLSCLFFLSLIILDSFKKQGSISRLE